MTKDLLSLPVADLTLFTRSLSRELSATGPAPSHLTLMNMLARAGGFRNVQHLRAAQSAGARLARPAPATEAVDHTLVARALAQFDDRGLLRQWPARRAVQVLCLWALWARLGPLRDLTERQISTALGALHHFGDAAILRRDMVALGLMQRTPGGTSYDRIERRPPATALALIQCLAARKAA